jgi:hypothetical protein
MNAGNRETAGPGPDFLCIGAQKAGTGWLYEQLRNHPDFWMPPMKELHYFDRRASAAAGNTQRSLPLARHEDERIAIARERIRDDRDREFLDRFEELAPPPLLDFDSYAELFRPAGDLLCGDITPGYSLLDDDLVNEITTRFAAAKIVFLARDPVERAWSQISMYVRRGLVDRFNPDDPDQISEQLHRPEILARSYPVAIVRRWKRFVNRELFRVYFFDDLVRDAAGLRHSMISFLGGDPVKHSGNLPATYNAKAKKQKLSMTQTAREHLARFFGDELRACAVELAGPAVDWPKRYGY